MQKIKDFFAGVSKALSGFYTKNRGLVLGGLTVVSIALIIWARFGFTFNFSQFYAAGPPNPPTPALSVTGGTCQADGTRTPYSLQWNSVVWTPCAGQSQTCYRLKRSPTSLGGGTDTNYPATTTVLKDYLATSVTTATQCTAGFCTGPALIPGYYYVVKVEINGPGSLDSNEVRIPPTPTTACPTPSPSATATATPSISPSPSATTTATATPTPTILPVVCAPQSQIVAVNQAAKLQASGGDGVNYSWFSEGQSESGLTSSFAYSTAGTKVVTVQSAGQSSSCSVTVQPSVSPVIGMAVTGRNATTNGLEVSPVAAFKGQQVEVITRITNPGQGILNNLNLKSVMASGLVYVVGSTVVNNAPAGTDSVIYGGLPLPALGPQQGVTVSFRVILGSSLPAGTSQVTVNLQATADGVQPANGQLIINVNSLAGRPGTVQTGPGETVLVALLVSSIIMLLYVSYTYSPRFQRREAESIAKDQNPLDFHS